TLISHPFFDQRGLPRDADGLGVVDIGAYERQEQTITFGSLASKTYGDADFTISATATSGLPVSFKSSNNAVATVTQVGNSNVWTVHITGAGSATITASQGGDTYLYNAAPDVAQSLTIVPHITAPAQTADENVSQAFSGISVATGLSGLSDS